ncbi:hypothetical protein KBZ21_40215, partial [Streptomyces sp. A73]|nr:hypothetical protein [Streptomyces sp. A73]
RTLRSDTAKRLLALSASDMRPSEHRAIDATGTRRRLQALVAIDWALANDFWQAHILSPAKLRAKYETLRRQAMSERRKQPAG